MSTFGQNLRYGGPQCVIFALIAGAFVQWIVTLGLSELASAFPSSGVRAQSTPVLYCSNTNPGIGPVSFYVYPCPREIQAVQRFRYRLDVRSCLVARDDLWAFPGRSREHWTGGLCESRLHT